MINAHFTHHVAVLHGSVGKPNLEQDHELAQIRVESSDIRLRAGVSAPSRQRRPKRRKVPTPHALVCYVLSAFNILFPPISTLQPRLYRKS